MKILHINSYYSGSNFYKNLYDKQNENGMDIDVYVPISTAFNFSNLNLGNYTTISANHNKYDRFLFHVKHKKVLSDIENKYRIKEYTLIHAHSLFSNGYIAMKLKEKFGIPYIVAVRNTDVNTFFKRMIHLRKLGVQILKEAEKVVFLSETYRDHVIGKYVPDKLREEINNKAIIIPNGIDDFWIKNLNNFKSHFQTPKVKLLYVGALNKNKNLSTTIKAIEQLQKSGFDVNYTIVGNNVEKKIYDQVINLPFIRYIAPVKKEDLIQIYRNNDIFVMPSINETFGLVYAEAMSQGLPVIYSKGQGFDGQFKDGEIGYSVASDSAEEIANKIQEVLTNYEAISNNCLRNVGKFNWDKITSEYIILYEKAVFKI